MKQMFYNLRKLILYNVRILFSHKFFYFFGAVLLYFVVVCSVNYFQAEDHITGRDVMPALLLPPACVLAVYLSMEIISFERENKTIESVFTTSGSIYKVWMIKLGVTYLIIIAVLLLLEILAFLFVAGFPIFSTLFHSIVPIIFIGNLTFYFSVKFRSGNAAGMITVIIILFFLMLTEPLEHSRFFLFLNPFNKPRDMELVIWDRIIFQNRIGIIAFSSLFLYLGMVATKKREKLL